MDLPQRRSTLKRKDDRVIIHFVGEFNSCPSISNSTIQDYDCFYASVFENENPALKSLPLAVQQKQIIVTCNYEARRRGLRKLQLITEAKKVCPEVVIVLGEQLDRFRDASKMLYRYLEAFSWNKKVERLGFDEVFMDVSDIVAYNHALLNRNSLQQSFFQLSRDDPTIGFEFDATSVSGHEYPEGPEQNSTETRDDDELCTRLLLGSHLARHLRHQLEENKGYTSTVGISTTKLISKLVGNLNKPKGQTTLMPPYEMGSDEGPSNITTFIDSHDIGKIPGIGFKMAHKLRNHFLARPAAFDSGLIYGGTKENVTVYDIRTQPDIEPVFLEKLLGGSGAEKGIGTKVYGLIHGVDDTEVREARKIPSQISIEDSYIRLNTMPNIHKEMRMLGSSLLRRMHVDLLEDDEDGESKWIALPKTIRLSTRPRPPRGADGTRTRSFNRISRSAPMPNLVYDLKDSIDSIVERLVEGTLIPMFRRLHPESHGWDLSLMNVCATNMVEAASSDGSGGGRDIGRMFKRQEEVLKEWKVEDKDVPPEQMVRVSNDDGVAEAKDCIPAEPSAGCEAAKHPSSLGVETGSEEIMIPTQMSDEEPEWIDDEEDSGLRCDRCGAIMPAFALPAHERFHEVRGS